MNLQITTTVHFIRMPDFVYENLKILLSSLHIPIINTGKGPKSFWVELFSKKTVWLKGLHIECHVKHDSKQAGCPKHKLLYRQVDSRATRILVESDIKK